MIDGLIVRQVDDKVEIAFVADGKYQVGCARVLTTDEARTLMLWLASVALAVEKEEPEDA